MPIYMIGGGGGGEPPFNRAFFTSRLGDILDRDAKERAVRLILYLVDGSALEVCNIDELSEQYMSVRAFNKDDQTCTMSVSVIPYGTIYRLEISPKGEDDSDRVGFRWTPETQRIRPARKR
jgi:hypothetical protein